MTETTARTAQLTRISHGFAGDNYYYTVDPPLSIGRGEFAHLNVAVSWGLLHEMETSVHVVTEGDPIKPVLEWRYAEITPEQALAALGYTVIEDTAP